MSNSSKKARRRMMNYGEGNLFNFHGAFTEKAAAVAKEQSIPGAFIRTVWFKGGPRYGVLTARKNPVPGRSRVPFAVVFRRHGTVHTWQRFAETAAKATESARKALRTEYPDGDYSLISVKPFTGKNPATKVHKHFPALSGWHAGAAEKAYAYADQMRAKYPGRKVEVHERSNGSWDVYVLNQPNPTPRVETYTLRAGTGKKIRKATRVIFADGRRVSFNERLSKREAIKQASALLAKGYRENRHRNKSIQQVGPGQFQVDNEHGTVLTLKKKPWGWEVWGDNARARTAWRGPGVHSFPTLAAVEKRYKAFRGISVMLKENPKRNTKVIGPRTPENIRKILYGTSLVIRTAGWDAMAREYEKEPAKRERIASFVSKDIARRFGPAKGAQAYDLLSSSAKWLAGKNPKAKSWHQAMAKIGSAKSAKAWLKAMGSLPGRKNSIVDAIRPGDRVTIVNRFGQQSTGRAVMRSSSGGWVLNMGGKHGTPGIASPENIVRISKRRKNTVAWGKHQDQKFVHQALAQLFPGKRVEQLTASQLSQVLRLAQDLKIGKKNPVMKVPGGWRAVSRRGRMGPVLPTRRDAEIYAESLQLNPRKQRRNAEWGTYEKGVFHPWTRRPKTRKKKAIRRLTRNPLTWGDAFELGAAAYRKGRKRVPAHDPDLMRAIYPMGAKSVPVGTHTPLFKAWLRGWDSENLRAGNPKRKNYADATELYKKFHGRGPSKVTDTNLPIADYGNHPELGQLGKMVSLTIGDEEAEKPWKKKIEWGSSEAPDLAAEPGGRQLYLIGGSQNLNGALESLPIDTDKDLLDLGFAYRLEYFTQKKFDDFQPVTYYHDLGEETGDRPRVVYDRAKKRIHLVGGAYQVKPEGIVN